MATIWNSFQVFCVAHRHGCISSHSLSLRPMGNWAGTDITHQSGQASQRAMSRRDKTVSLDIWMPSFHFRRWKYVWRIWPKMKKREKCVTASAQFHSDPDSPMSLSMCESLYVYVCVYVWHTHTNSRARSNSILYVCLRNETNPQRVIYPR